MTTATGYVPGSSGTGIGPAASDKPKTAGSYWTLEQCKQAYLDYTGSKSAELDEIKEARRYRHHSQWTAAQIKVFNERKQPVVTYPRIGRKIDGIVGTVERLKQDPKAYPRTPQQEQGADLATAVLRYAMESQNWEAKTPIAADYCATDGHSGVELEVIQGDRGDNEVGLNLVEDGFFYDPRSFRLDFSDARYMGVSKLVDIDTAIEMMPDNEAEIRASSDAGSELSNNSDRDAKWFSTIGKRKFIRLVDLWYRHKGEWCWAIYTGSHILMEGQSFFVDEKKKTASKYIMFRCAVDQDGDSYGFPRALKSAQDETNQRHSKDLHILNTRRIIIEQGAFDNVEEARREIARPDGVVVRNKGFEAEFDDNARAFDFTGHQKMMEHAELFIDNFGPSQVVTGEGVDGQSGRAIALRQNAALAELGPFILSYRGWKLRVYRAMFAAIQKYWTGERWIRVTDDEGLAQFIQVNGTQTDPNTGQSQLVNALGSIDVDIILDEGPDTINAQADTHDTLKEIIPSIAPMLSPAKASALIDVFISTSMLQSEVKKKYADVSRAEAEQPPQPDPEIVKAQTQLQISQQTAQADMQIAQQKAQTDGQIAQGKAMNDAQVMQAKAEMDAQVAQQRAQAEIQLKREVAAAEMELDRHKAAAQIEIERQKAEHAAELADKQADAKARNDAKRVKADA